MSAGKRMVLGAVAMAALVAGCGQAGRSPRGDAARDPVSRYPVSVASSFPARQRLAQQTTFTVRVKNTGSRALPDVAVTVLNPRYGSAAQAFGRLIPANRSGQPILASRSRPVWIVDREPGPCRYSCRHRGPGGAASALTDTWTLGRLAPGRTAVFSWRVTAVRAGAFVVEYEVAAGLDGRAVAVRSVGVRGVRGVGGGGGEKPVRGFVRVRISSVPPNVTVQPNGRVTRAS